MAEIVGAVGVPHHPSYPQEAARAGDGSRPATLFAPVRAELEAMHPDALVVFTADHLNTFFFDNLPLVSIGVADRTSGPNDDTVMPRYEVPVAEDLAGFIREWGIARGFDLGVTHEFAVDHSVLVPLHFLTPAMQVPIVPVFIAAIAPPLPRAGRCHALGAMVREAIGAWPSGARVAILASGSLCYDVGGSRAPGDELSGCPDPVWAAHLVERITRGEAAALVAEATDERIRGSGNVSGELLTWLALLGALADRVPALVRAEIELGHAFAAWRGG